MRTFLEISFLNLATHVFGIEGSSVRMEHRVICISDVHGNLSELQELSALSGARWSATDTYRSVAATY